MPNRRALLQHQQQLGDITNIVNAMKNLAFLETRKLNQGLEHLQNTLSAVETATADFLQFYPEHALRPESTAELRIFFGSERGFCGDFNGALLANLQEHPPFAAIAVGSRLHNLLNTDADKTRSHIMTVTGASVAEEVKSTLAQLMEAIADIESKHPKQVFTLSALYHDNHRGLRRQILLPPPIETSESMPNYQQAPLIYLDAENLYRELSHHRLSIALQQIAASSLMAENQRRIQHMDGAAQYLEKTLNDLSRHYQQLRQEEITEEIEMITLNSLGDTWEVKHEI